MRLLIVKIRILIPLLFLCTFMHAQRQVELIALNTNNLSFILEVDEKGTLLHRYFGEKLLDISPYLLKSWENMQKR